MKEIGKRIWFPAKRYGWGWGFPNCWQGWTVFAVWIALVVTGVVAIGSRPVFFVIYMIVLALLLVLVCWIKGEKPRWRWGERRK